MKCAPYNPASRSHRTRRFWMVASLDNPEVIQDWPSKLTRRLDADPLSLDLLNSLVGAPPRN